MKRVIMVADIDAPGDMRAIKWDGLFDQDDLPPHTTMRRVTIEDLETGEEVNLLKEEGAFHEV